MNVDLSSPTSPLSLPESGNSNNITATTTTFQSWSAALAESHNIDLGVAELIVLGCISGAVAPKVRVCARHLGIFPLTLPIAVATQDQNVQRAARDFGFHFIRRFEAMVTDFVNADREDVLDACQERKSTVTLVQSKLRNLRRVEKEPNNQGFFDRVDPATIEVQIRGALLDQKLATKSFQEIKLGLRPSIVVNHLEAKLALNPYALAFDRKVLSYSLNGEALKDFVKLNRDVQRMLLAYLNTGFTGGPWIWGSVINSESPVGTFWLGTPEDVEAFLSVVAREDAAIAPFLLVSFPAAPVSPRKDSSKTYDAKLWNEFLETHFDFRLNGNPTPQILDFSSEGQAAFNEAVKANEKQILELPETRRVSFGGVPELVAKVAALIQIAKPPFTGTEIGAEAVKLAHAIVQRVLEQQYGPDRSHRDESDDDALRAVIAKLEAKGPMTIRNIVRSFNNQSYSRVSAILERAEKCGEIEITERKVRIKTKSVSGVSAVSASVGHF